MFILWTEDVLPGYELYSLHFHLLQIHSYLKDKFIIASYRFNTVFKEPFVTEFRISFFGTSGVGTIYQPDTGLIAGIHRALWVSVDFGNGKFWSSLPDASTSLTFYLLSRYLINLFTDIQLNITSSQHLDQGCSLLRTSSIRFQWLGIRKNLVCLSTIIIVLHLIEIICYV